MSTEQNRAIFLSIDFLKHMLLYRISSVSMVRAGRRHSKLTILLSLCVAVIIGFLILSLISEDIGQAPDGKVIERQSELLTWPMNRSVNLEDYLDPSNINSFIWQPIDVKSSVNDGSIYCERENVNVLALVTSSPNNFEARQAIRETWGSKEDLAKRRVRLVFVLGYSGNEKTEELVAKEATNYGDIIEEDFIDTYHNLTLKSITMLKWVNLTCSSDKMPSTSFPYFILKVDDDIFINVDRLLTVIHDMPHAQMIGRLTCGARPIADVHSKFYMPHYLFQDFRYPGYLSGTAYLIRGEIVPILLQNALLTPLIHLEDIYVTALLARKSHIYPEDTPYFTFSRVNPKTRCAFKYLVSSHQIKPHEMHTVWASLRKPVNCSSEPKKHNWFRKVPRMTKRLKEMCMFTK